MEKRISIFIGRTIFSLVKIYRISILIGYTVFLTSEENRIVILLTTWPPCWGAKGYLAFVSKRRRVSPIKKHETERRTALTRFFSPNNGETNGMILFSEFNILF